MLKKRFNYRPYPYKHYESVFTRFYQAYILPKKFGVDKRKLHLSNLIISKEITREQALINLQKETYLTNEEEKKDINYFIKKMKWKAQDLENYLLRPEKNHQIYGSEKNLWNKLKHIYQSSDLLKFLVKNISK